MIYIAWELNEVSPWDMEVVFFISNRIISCFGPPDPESESMSLFDIGNFFPASVVDWNIVTHIIANVSVST